MGERRRAAASLWLEHAPSIGLAIGPRHRHSPVKHLLKVKLLRRYIRQRKLHSEMPLFHKCCFLLNLFLHLYILKQFVSTGIFGIFGIARRPHLTQCQCSMGKRGLKNNLRYCSMAQRTSFRIYCFQSERVIAPNTDWLEWCCPLPQPLIYITRSAACHLYYN